MSSFIDRERLDFISRDDGDFNGLYPQGGGFYLDLVSGPGYEGDTPREAMSEERKYWSLGMLAEPIVPAWSTTSRTDTNGAELQRAIILGFSEKGDPIWKGYREHKEFTFEKVFTFKEHGEFFRGALTMASMRYAGDFYELLQRYGTIKVTITKSQEVEK